MKKLLLILLLLSEFAFSQMPDISKVWLNQSRPYIGTIGNENETIKLKIEISEQNKKNDQEYFVSGYSVVEDNTSQYEGKFTITNYRDGKKKGVVYGDYELAEENKGRHSGVFKGKFVYTFQWNRKTEEIENPDIKLSGNWISYDRTLDLKTNLTNR